jgi:hypothetical protein
MGHASDFADCSSRIRVLEYTHYERDVEAVVCKWHRLEITRGGIYLSDIAHVGHTVLHHGNGLVKHRDSEIMRPGLQQGARHNSRAASRIQQITAGTRGQGILDKP